MKFLLSIALRMLPLPAGAQPGALAIGWRMGWAKGWLVRPLWKLREVMGGSKIQVGQRFSLQGAFSCRGPGRVILGDDVTVAMICTPFTHDAQAIIQIGSRCFLNGTRFGCSRSISVGDDCILADARIMDTDFHPIGVRRTGPGIEIGVAPIVIERNVWVAAGAAILKGVRVGENSVIAFGAVVVKDVPALRIVGGNPAKEIGNVPLN